MPLQVVPCVHRSVAPLASVVSGQMPGLDMAKEVPSAGAVVLAALAGVTAGLVANDQVRCCHV